MRVLSELARQVVVSVVSPVNGVDQYSSLVRIGLFEGIASDTTENETTKGTRTFAGDSKKGQRSEREADGVDRARRQMLDDSRGQISIISRVMRAWRRSMSEQIDTDGRPAGVGEQEVETGALPGGCVRTAPTVNEKNRRSRHIPHEAST